MKALVPTTPLYSMFIDEVGNHDLALGRVTEEGRYLSLTGVIFNRDNLRPLRSEIEELCDVSFGRQVVLHRKEILRRDGAFGCLRDIWQSQPFDQRLERILTTTPYTVITASLDKREYVGRYRGWAMHPYHYCLEVLLERYVLFLRDVVGRGDVVVESRGAVEDMLLKSAYRSFHQSGTSHVGPANFPRFLTSGQLKIRPKRAGWVGLQVADLVAHPAWMWMLDTRLRRPQRNGFGARISAVLAAEKFRRATNGAIDGWGAKWLP